MNGWVPTWLGLPELASAHGAEVDRVLGLVHLLIAVLFVGWGVFFAVALVRFRAGRNRPADPAAGLRGRAPVWVEAGVVVAEAVLLLGFSIPFWARQEREAVAPAIEVRVVAEQFAWNVHYPGADGRFGRTAVERVDAVANPLGLDREDPAAADDVATVNQLHLPVGRPVRLLLSSKDVVHSFMLAELRVKRDAIPGRTAIVRFTPTVTTAAMRERTGRGDFGYEIACAQLCGLGHYRMRGFLTVETEEEFAAWLSGQAGAAEGVDPFWQ